jgi:hypothetical protein
MHALAEPRHSGEESMKTDREKESQKKLLLEKETVRDQCLCRQCNNLPTPPESHPAHPLLKSSA